MTVAELQQRLRGVDADQGDVVIDEDGHDLVVTRADGAVVAIPIGKAKPA